MYDLFFKSRTSFNLSLEVCRVNIRVFVSIDGDSNVNSFFLGGLGGGVAEAGSKVGDV